MKVAIIGSGAAAVGVLRALEEWSPKSDVTVFERGPILQSNLETTDPPDRWTDEYYRTLYKYIRKKNGIQFPPPKTHFGLNPAKNLTSGTGKVFESRLEGGLTNFWGGSVFPYTDEDLTEWPIDASDLEPYYQRIADMMGISGRKDKLSDHLGVDFVNRPPVETSKMVEHLEFVVNADFSINPYSVIAGASRITIETRDGKENQCVYSGECMVGCSKGAIYSARKDINRYQKTGLISRLVKAEVRSIKIKTRRIELDNSMTESFDKIYIAAGCPGSTEIVMRSLDISDNLSMSDNELFSFPIIYLGRDLREEDVEKYLALTNLILLCIPERNEEKSAYIQIYPSFDYLWRYYVPIGLWRYIQPLANLFRRRLLWARLYLHSDYSKIYSVSMDDNSKLSINLDRAPTPLKNIDGLWKSIRHAIGQQGFYVPNLPPIRSPSSYHYGSSLPYGNGFTNIEGEISDSVYLCDSAAFNNGPAPSPTFTIMANACRITHRGL